MAKYNAGALRERVELLDLVQVDEGEWQWVKYSEIWAAVELTGKTTLFSRLGIGARAAEIGIRKRALTPHQAIRWRGLHLFISEITEPERGWLNVQAAVVEVTRCREFTGQSPGPVFPAVLTEQYLAHAQERPMASNTSDYVLVVPKAIRLTPGRKVEVGVPAPDEGGEGRVMLVRTAHTTDPFKNEYDVREKVDL